MEHRATIQNKGIPPSSNFNLVKSYINEGQFKKKKPNIENSSPFQINSGVPKGEFLVLLSIYSTHLTYQEPGKLH